MADAEKGPIRFVITHLNNDGARTLTEARQGRFTYETREEAQERLEVFRPSYAAQPELGVPAHTMEVRPVECWPGHHDPKTCWFDVVKEGQRWYHKHGRDHYVDVEELVGDSLGGLVWSVRDSNPPPNARQPREVTERYLWEHFVLAEVDQRDRRNP